MVMEIDDLIDWAVENYKSLMVDQLERILNGKENTTEKGKSRINMLNSYAKFKRLGISDMAFSVIPLNAYKHCINCL